MEEIKVTSTFLLKIKDKYCSWNKICEDYKEEVCKPWKCKFFKEIVLPTWFRDMKRRHGRKLKISQEFKQFIAVMVYLKIG